MVGRSGDGHRDSRAARRRSARASLALALALVLAVVGAGCGGGGGGGQANKEQTSQRGNAEVTVGLYPVVNFAPLFLGIKKGFFDQQHIRIKTQMFAGGSQIIPGLIGNKIDIGFSNPVSVILAAQKGLPVRIISQASQARSATHGFSGVVVLKSSPIKSAKDLEGKTVAVNLLKNIGDVTIKYSIEKAGGDPSKVKFTEIPFPDMNQALQQHRVDAVWDLDPFLTQARKDLGARVLFYNYAETAPHLTNTVGMATQSYIQQNKDVVDRFVKAYNQSLDYANAHPDEARQVVASYTKIAPDLLKQMVLPYWSSDLNLPSLQKQAQLMQKYGVTDKTFDVKSIVYSG